MSDIQSFREAVEAFISSHGWTATRFGRQMAGDPLFVFDLREGREPRSDTRTRILKAMQEQAETPAAPPLRATRSVCSRRAARCCSSSRSPTIASSKTSARSATSTTRAPR